MGRAGRQWLKAADANGDGNVSQAEWRQFSIVSSERAATLAARQQKASQAKGAAARATPRQTFLVPMNDGAKLATDVYLPAGKGPFPVILTRTPYSKTKETIIAPTDNFTQHGYVFVIQDMRGRYASEGENLPHVGCGWGEHQDGVETVAWILKQPWCNGKLGTHGGSAMGTTQNLLAGAAPRGLTAQYILYAPAEPVF